MPAPIIPLLLAGLGLFVVAKMASPAAKAAPSPSPRPEPAARTPVLPLPGPSGCYTVPAYGGPITNTDIIDIPEVPRAAFIAALNKGTDPDALDGLATTLDCLFYHKAAQRFRVRATQLRTLAARALADLAGSRTTEPDTGVEGLSEPLRTAVKKAIASPLATPAELTKLAQTLDDLGQHQAATALRNEVAKRASVSHLGFTRGSAEGPDTMTEPILLKRDVKPASPAPAPDPIDALTPTALRDMVRRALAESTDPDALTELAATLPLAAKAVVLARASELRVAADTEASRAATVKALAETTVNDLPEPLRSNVKSMMGSSIALSSELSALGDQLTTMGYNAAAGEVYAYAEIVRSIFHR